VTRRIEGEARQAVIRAQEQARRFGQHFIGCEHLLYGVAGADDAVGGILRARGVTPERVDEQLAVLVRRSRSAAPRRTDLDGDALDAIGVDLDAVRARVEQAFGPGSLDRAAAARSGRAKRDVTGHLRVTRQARACLKRSIRAASAQPDGRRDTAQLALILLDVKASAARSILTTLGVSAPELSAEISNAL
jgi:ATP-dependent Clp protease ATP-binding subunit ClpA